MNFIRQGLGIALQPELTLKEKPVEGSPLFLLQMCMEQLVAIGKI